VVLFIAGSLALGFLFSTLSRTQLQAMQMSFFYIMPSVLLSGFAFPFQGMPVWAQGLGNLLPVTHFLRVVRGAVLKGEGVSDLSHSLAALCAFLLAAGMLAMLRYRTTLD
jgi:ABC-2 type transport system permease protein